jgi:hypothetical protein
MKAIKLFLYIAILLQVANVNAEVLDGSAPLLCASTELFECTFEDGCVEVQPEDVNAPQFLRVNYKKKIIQAIPSRKENPDTKIEHSENIDGKLIMQGIEDGIEGVRDGLGWTLTITEDTGKMSLTASGEEVGFVILGACTKI